MLIRPLRDSDEEHTAIAKAAVDRQADLAVQLLSAHYEKTGAFLREALCKRGVEG